MSATKVSAAILFDLDALVVPQNGGGGPVAMAASANDPGPPASGGMGDASWLWDVAADSLRVTGIAHTDPATSLASYCGGLGNWLGQVHREERAHIGAMVRSGTGANAPLVVEFRFAVGPGDHRCFRLRGRCQMDGDKRLTRIQGWLTDIGQQAEEAATRARLATVLEATTDLAVTCNSEGQIQYMNYAGRQLFGLAVPDPSRPVRLADLLARDAMESMINEGIPVAFMNGAWSGEAAVLAGDGRAVPVSAVVVVHKTACGLIEYYSVILRDITLQRQIAISTEARERKARIENAVRAILLTPDDGMHGEMLYLLLEIFAADSGVFGIVETGDDLVWKAGAIDGDVDSCPVIRPPDRWPPALRAAMGEAFAVAVNEISAGPFDRHIDRVWLTAPLVEQGRIVGTLVLGRSGPVWQDSERDQLENLCLLIAPVLAIRIARARAEAARAGRNRTGAPSRSTAGTRAGAHRRTGARAGEGRASRPVEVGLPGQ